MRINGCSPPRDSPRSVGFFCNFRNVIFFRRQFQSHKAAATLKLLKQQLMITADGIFVCAIFSLLPFHDPKLNELLCQYAQNIFSLANNDHQYSFDCKFNLIASVDMYQILILIHWHHAYCSLYENSIVLKWVSITNCACEPPAIHRERFNSETMCVWELASACISANAYPSHLWTNSYSYVCAYIVDSDSDT